MQQIEDEGSSELVRPVDSGNLCIRMLRVIILSILVMAIAVFYWGLFFMGDYGYGDIVYLYLEGYGSFFYGCAIASFCLVLFLTIFDIGYWRGVFWYIGQGLIALTLSGFLVTALTFTSTFPAASICVYIVLCPLILYLFKMTLLRGITNETFILWIGIDLTFVAVVMFVLWVIWISQDHYWNNNTKIDFFIRLECLTAETLVVISPGNLTEFLDKLEAQGECDEAFLMYVTPLIFSVFSLIIAVSLFFLHRTRISYYKNKKRMDTTTQAFLMLLSLVLLGMWASAGIAGAQMGLATVVFTFSFLFLVVGSTAIVLVTGFEQFRKDIMSAPLAKRIVESSGSDWFRALFLIALAPASVVIVPLSYLRQLGRKHIAFTKTLDERERRLVFSLELTKFFVQARHWHWTSVLTKVIWWGVAFFVINVVCARVLNLFFSWLNSEFVERNLDLGSVVGIFFLCSVIIFQFPPTPGMPVFYAAAVIITQAALNSGWSFWAGWAISTAVSVGGKYSCVLIGQFIGQVWGARSVSIRKTVGVNSKEIRAIKYLLTRKGISFQKVSILIGGPDWPVAVIAGILKTSYIQNSIGNLPIIIVIIPITIAGSFILVADQNSTYASIAAIALSIAVLIQGLTMLLALHSMETVTREKSKELDEFPMDEEVARLDEKSAIRARVRRSASKWRNLPIIMKLFILSGSLAETASAYVFLLFGSRCFVHFGVNDSIDVVLDGNPTNLVKTLGWIGIGLFLYGCLVLIFLGRWISCNMSKGVDEPEVEGFSSKKGEYEVEPDDDNREEVAEVYTERYERCFGACC